MKVVINTREMYMQLSRPQMDMICALLGWTLSGIEAYQRSSKDCWFNDENGNLVDWVQFRAHPTLVQLVEEGKMHKGLMIIEIPDGTGFDIVTHDDHHGPYSQDLYSYHYSGEIVVRRERSAWYPEGMGDRNFYANTKEEEEGIKAEWDGEDWWFRGIPLEVCPNWGGTTCFSKYELNYEGTDPAGAIEALMYWVNHGESQPTP